MVIIIMIGHLEKFSNGSSMRYTVSMMNITELRKDQQRAVTCNIQNFSTRVAVHMNITQARVCVSIMLTLSPGSRDEASIMHGIV